MDHNYNDTPLLTSSDYENLMEELKTENFAEYGSPLRLEQNVTYEDSSINPMIRSLVQNTGVLAQPSLPPLPPLEKFGLVSGQVENRRESVHSTSPPEPSPSLSPTGTIPSRDEYLGYFEFSIFLDSTTSNKKSWLYSHNLRKVFIDMHKSLLIQFRVKEFRSGLFVRALPVYEQDDYVSIPVQRCALHMINGDPHGKAHPDDEPRVCYCPSMNLVRHVVVCSHPQANYVYDPESDRHSVVVPLQAPHPGNDTTTVEYHFTCKTSCPRGMNRKPIVVIFTLENEQCEVLGRFILPVKICSCPKRDKEKEEQEVLSGTNTPKQGKRRLSSAEKQEAKRLKTDISRQNDAIQEASDDATKRWDAKYDEIRRHIDEKFKLFESTMQEQKEKFQQLEFKLDKILNKLCEK